MYASITKARANCKAHPAAGAAATRSKAGHFMPLPFAGPAVYPIAAPSLYHLKEFMATYIAYAIALAFPLLLICVFIHDGITSKRRQQEELLARAIEKAFTNAARKRRAELLKHNEKP